LIFSERARYQTGMRALFLCLTVCLFAVTGCASLVRQDGDFFEAARVPPDQFERDNNGCRLQAENFLTYDPRGMGGTRYQRNRTYNAIYGRCMTAKGYRPRPYYKNWLPG
jgi:hypothetical protein